MHAKFVPVQSKYQCMTGFGINLTAWKNYKVMFAREIANLIISPESIMVSETDSVEPQRLRAVYQLVYAHETVIRMRVAVSVKIYQQELSI